MPNKGVCMLFVPAVGCGKNFDNCSGEKISFLSFFLWTGRTLRAGTWDFCVGVVADGVTDPGGVAPDGFNGIAAWRSVYEAEGGMFICMY